MKTFYEILACVFWGVLSATIFPFPFSLIIAGVGGGFIGLVWDKFWNFIKNDK